MGIEGPSGPQVGAQLYFNVFFVILFQIPQPLYITIHAYQFKKHSV